MAKTKWKIVYRWLSQLKIPLRLILLNANTASDECLEGIMKQITINLLLTITLW